MGAAPQRGRCELHQGDMGVSPQRDIVNCTEGTWVLQGDMGLHLRGDVVSFSEGTWVLHPRGDTVFC